MTKKQKKTLKRILVAALLLVVLKLLPLSEMLGSVFGEAEDGTPFVLRKIATVVL